MALVLGWVAWQQEAVQERNQSALRASLGVMLSRAGQWWRLWWFIPSSSVPVARVGPIARGSLTTRISMGVGFATVGVGLCTADQAAGSCVAYECGWVIKLRVGGGVVSCGTIQCVRVCHGLLLYQWFVGDALGDRWHVGPSMARVVLCSMQQAVTRRVPGAINEQAVPVRFSSGMLHTTREMARKTRRRLRHPVLASRTFMALHPVVYV